MRACNPNIILEKKEEQSIGKHGIRYKAKKFKLETQRKQETC